MNEMLHVTGKTLGQKFNRDVPRVTLVQFDGRYHVLYVQANQDRTQYEVVSCQLEAVDEATASLQAAAFLGYLDPGTAPIELYKSFNRQVVNL